MALQMERPRPAQAAEEPPPPTVTRQDVRHTGLELDNQPQVSTIVPGVDELPPASEPATMALPIAAASTPAEMVPQPAVSTITPAPAAAPTVAQATAAPPATAAPAAARRKVTTLSAQERREAAMPAELFSILVAAEHLEGAFIRGAVSNEDYNRNCTQILAQFKTLKAGLKDKYPDIRDFIRQQGLKCPLAEERLLGTGVAATALHATHDTASSKESLACFKASEGFITLRDALELKLDSVDQLLPLVRDLQASIASIPSLPPLPGIERIATYLVLLNNMHASDRLDEARCRQLSLDVEQAYTSLKNWLQEKS